MPRAPKLHLVGGVCEGIEKLPLKSYPPDECDYLFLASFFRFEDAHKMVYEYNKPIVVYCWDYYSWNHGDGRWARYANLLRDASLIIVPSNAQKLRLKELLGLDSVFIRSGVTLYKRKVSDQNFILDPVRYYPEENQVWAATAAAELGIPLIHSEHQFTPGDFKKLVATCTFLTCAYREASTGGLTLVEGMNLGKPSLVSNSPYMGARDYLGDQGFYFQYDSYEDLKKQMKLMWETRPKVKLEGDYSYKTFVKKICEAINKLKKN